MVSSFFFENARQWRAERRPTKVPCCRLGDRLSRLVLRIRPCVFRVYSSSTLRCGRSSSRPSVTTTVDRGGTSTLLDGGDPVGHCVTFHRAARDFNIRLDNEEYKLISRALDLIEKQQFRTSIRFETRQQRAYKQPGILETYGVTKVLNSPITIRYHNFRNLVKRIIF